MFSTMDPMTEHLIMLSFGKVIQKSGISISLGSKSINADAMVQATRNLQWLKRGMKKGDLDPRKEACLKTTIVTTHSRIVLGG